uniref:Ribosomal biogenesis factor n=3 Tax=Canis lupus TaxID=9612 RepID=A0A8C0MXG5_CANLF
MAKNKLRGEKSRSVFHIASQKKTNLQISQKAFSLEPLQKQLIPQQCHENEPVNVDKATRLMAQL